MRLVKSYHPTSLKHRWMIWTGKKYVALTGYWFKDNGLANWLMR
jgi:hypothetical protein